MFNPNKVKITVLFMWALAMLCVWANYKDTSVLLIGCAFCLGGIHQLVLQIVEYNAAIKRMKSNRAVGIMMAYNFKLSNSDMVAVFDLTNITLGEVKDAIENDEYDTRITIMTKGQYESLEIQDDNGKKIMDFCDFLNKGGKP